MTAIVGAEIDFDQHTGSHRVMATWIAPVGAWTSTFRPAYGYGVQSFSVGTNTGELRDGQQSVLLDGRTWRAVPSCDSPLHSATA